jgi:aryl-alcohol dehydrogenase-like predicted oxidoreductase/predicted kinase
MRLSTDPARDDARGIATIHAALDAGATLLDTADVYALDAADLHHNERLVARALSTWSGDRSRVVVVTKGGLVHDGARYAADGRAIHLRAACEASREALGAPSIDVYLLHAVDPRTPLETSVRALESLRAAGLVRRIGLSNVTLTELDRARAIADISVVEAALGPFDDAALRGGLAERCAKHGILLLAHSPLGGPRRRSRLGRDAVLASVGARHGATAAQITIAWIRDLHPCITPIPGARTPEAARAALEAAQITLTDADRAALDARVFSASALRTPRASRRPPDDAPGDVVVLMGIQGAGKSTSARELAADGYHRLNRDELGGRLRGLVPRLEVALGSGAARVVLDNTYATRASRNEVIEAAWRHGVPARCVCLDTPIPIAQANVARRMIEATGRLLEPAEIVAAAKKDPSIVPPRALFRFRRELEPPSPEEGFRSIVIVPFVRRPLEGSERAATLVALDALVTKGALDELRIARLEPDRDLVFGWLPSTNESIASRVRERGFEVVTCAHPAGPPVCWCRPPLPGLIVALTLRHRLDVGLSTIVGAHAAHRAIAGAVGMHYVADDDYFMRTT